MLARHVVVCLAVTLLMAPDVSADPPDELVSGYLRSHVAISELRLPGGLRVGVSGESKGTDAELQAVGVACAAAARTTSRGRVATEVMEATFCDGRLRYQFDPRAWTARMWGTVDTKVTTVRYVQVKGERKQLSESSRRGRLRIDLRWTGAGPTTTEREASASVCYFTVVCPAARVAFSRAAVVSGTLAFGGMGVHVQLPRGHPGVLGYSAGTY